MHTYLARIFSSIRETCAHHRFINDVSSGFVVDGFTSLVIPNGDSYLSKHLIFAFIWNTNGSMLKFHEGKVYYIAHYIFRMLSQRFWTSETLQSVRSFNDRVMGWKNKIWLWSHQWKLWHGSVCSNRAGFFLLYAIQLACILILVILYISHFIYSTICILKKER